jgi:hypothetical protein
MLLIDCADEQDHETGDWISKPFPSDVKVDWTFKDNDVALRMPPSPVKVPDAPRSTAEDESTISVVSMSLS